MSVPPGFWDGVLRRLEGVVPVGFLNGWLRSLAVEAGPEGLCLRCASPFQRDRIQGRYLAAIERAVAEEAGAPLRVALDLGGPAPDSGPAVAPPAIPAGAPARRPTPAPVAPRQIELPYTFESFVVGPCNALAREAAFAVAHGRQSRANPLFISAAHGLGKTHLARATAAEARALGRKGALYLSAEAFTHGFTRSLRSRDTAERFKRRFRRECELLVVEDVQFLSSKRATQLELFHTISHLLDAGVRVVVTGHRMPRELHGLDERLCSQLAAGLVAELEPPDASVRRRILRTKAAAGAVRIPEDCLDLLVETLRGSVRDLEGVLVQLVESAALLKQPIDLELTRGAIHKVAPVETGPRALDLDAVLGAVAAATGTTRQALCARSRRRDAVQPRQLAMYLSHRFTDASLSEIGQALQRKHPSVRNAIRAVERGVLQRPQLRYQVEALVARLEELRSGSR